MSPDATPEALSGPTSRLTGADCRRILGLAARIGHADDLDGFVHAVIEHLPAIVRCDRLAYNEVNPRARRIRGIVSPALENMASFQQAWATNMHEHPLLQHCMRTGDATALRISDFLSRRAYHNTRLYDEVYRPIEGEFQVAFELPSRRPLVVAIALNRANRDFSAHDRALLNYLRPFLARAYSQVEQTALLRDRLARLQGAFERLDDGVVVVQGSARVRLWNDPARLWLGEFFPGPARSQRALPEALAEWLRSSAAAPGGVVGAVLTVRCGSSRLTIRALRGKAADETLLVLSRVREELSPEPLRRLGLTPREAQVLLWLTHGKSNLQIAQILRLSRRTVQKHLEHIFTKLGVESRTAASLRAAEILRGEAM